MGLRLRILLVFLLTTVLCTVIVVAGVVMPKLGQYKTVNAELAATSLQSAELAGRYLAEQLRDTRRRLAWLARNEALTYRDHQAAHVLFARLSREQPDHPPIVALDAAFQVVASSDALLSKDFRAISLVQEALKADRTVTATLAAWPGDGKPAIATAQRFKYYDRAGEHWGVVVEGERLSAWQSALNARSGRVEVFDAVGRMLVPPPARLAPAQDRPEALLALAGQRGTHERPDHAVVAYVPVGEGQLAVVAWAPAAQRLLPLDADIRQATLAGAIAMGVGMAMAIALSAFLVAPIRRLEAGAAALARGEWEAGGTGRAPLPTNRGDELGSLAVSFEKMAAELHARFRTIEGEVAARTADLASANHQLSQAVDDLKALDELKRSFLDAVSHELRTPLNFVMGYGSMLEDGLLGELSEEQTYAVNRMLEGSDRLLGVINDLIEISQLQAGQLVFHEQVVDPGELADIALSLQERAIAERGHQILRDFPATLPPALADPERVGQILRQLLSNAVKFTPPGGTITLRGRQEGDHVVLEVQDTGPGIPEDWLPHIWESFRQGDGSMTRSHGGTGVGLAIVKRLIEAMGETVTVSSRPGEGARFRFTLRVADLPGDPTETAERRVPGSTQAPSQT